MPKQGARMYQLRAHMRCREYQRAVEEHEAAAAMRRQQASDAAAESHRLAQGRQLRGSSPERSSACIPSP